MVIALFTVLFAAVLSYVMLFYFRSSWLRCYAKMLLGILNVRLSLVCTKSLFAASYILILWRITVRSFCKGFISTVRHIRRMNSGGWGWAGVCHSTNVLMLFIRSGHLRPGSQSMVHSDEKVMSLAQAVIGRCSQSEVSWDWSTASALLWCWDS